MGAADAVNGLVVGVSLRLQQPGSLHNNLEFQEVSVGHLCISTIHQELQVCMNTRVSKR